MFGKKYVFTTWDPAEHTFEENVALTSEAMALKAILEESIKAGQSAIMADPKAKPGKLLGNRRQVLTMVAASVTKVFDSKRLKAERPDIAEEYTTERPKAAYIRR